MQIPFELVDGIPLIDVVIDGQKGQMAFDTGAMATCINQRYFVIAEGEEAEVKKFDEELTASAVRKGVNTISFGGRTLEQVKTLGMDFDYVEQPLRKEKPDLIFLGTLGIDVIGQTNIKIDYQKHQISCDGQIALDTIGQEIEMTMVYLPVIAVQLADKTYPFVLDTGANTCVVDPEIYPEAVGSVVTLSQLVWGQRTYDEVTAVVSDLSHLRKKVEAYGIIGYQVLKEHAWYLDFNNQNITLLD